MLGDRLQVQADASVASGEPHKIEYVIFDMDGTYSIPILIIIMLTHVTIFKVFWSILKEFTQM